MSAPTNNTFLLCAKVSAVLTEMVVFPSPLIEEEMRNFLVSFFYANLQSGTKK